MQFEGIVLSINEIVVVFKSMQNRNKLETSLKQYKIIQSGNSLNVKINMASKNKHTKINLM